VRPHFEVDGVAIYRGDCREILPSIEGALAIVTDPPYGTGWVRGSGKLGEFNAKPETPEWDVWSTDWLHLAPVVRHWAVFAPLSRLADLRAALPNSAVAYWRKTTPRPNGPVRDAIVLAPDYLPAGVEFAAYNGDTPFHPCQKPTDLMQWVLGFVPPELTICDPFMGSGSTLVAAHALGRRCIGIDRDASYVATAMQRLAQGSLSLGGVA
jgi:site-specific DNA-methyltransferase (adenine-specific)